MWGNPSGKANAHGLQHGAILDAAGETHGGGLRAGIGV
jgi:hypothetical protein